MKIQLPSVRERWVYQPIIVVPRKLCIVAYGGESHDMTPNRLCVGGRGPMLCRFDTQRSLARGSKASGLFSDTAMDYLAQQRRTLYAPNTLCVAHSVRRYLYVTAGVGERGDGGFSSSPDKAVDYLTQRRS